jgi:hypothetical protein
MRTSSLFGVVALLGGVTALSGCVVDDSSSGNRGRVNTPVATAPDSGAPNRRGTATEEINRSQPDQPADADIKVDPQSGSTTPPPEK